MKGGLSVCLALLLFYIMGTASPVEAQCPITNATIRIDTTTSVVRLADRDDLEVTIDGITTGGIFTSGIWMRNGSTVDRNTPLPGGSFFDGGGQPVHTGNPPCEQEMYRIALLVRGYAPGSYSYNVTNAQTPGGFTSPTFLIQDPGPPTNIMLSQISNRRVQATWTPPAGFSGATYRVYLNTMDVITGGAPVTDGTTFVSGPHSTGFTVILRIRASTGSYLSVPALSETFSVRDVLTPRISTSVTATSATLSMSQPTNSLPVDSYAATLTSTACIGVPTRLGSTTSNSTTISSLEAGIQYSVSVTGTNNLAELTGTGTTTLTTSETAPSGSPGSPTSSVTTSTSITITWTEIVCLDRNGVITGYTIRYGPVNTSPTTIDHNNVNMRSRQITGLIPFTNYIISVRGVNSVGPGDYSTGSIIRTAEDRPTAVVGLSGTPKFFSVVLTWREPVPLNGILNTYIIRYSVNGSSEVTNTTRATTFTIADLNPNTVVSNIRVRAATGAGDGPEKAIIAVITLDRLCFVPDIQVKVLSATSVEISWNSVQDITDYVVYYRQTGNRMRQPEEMSLVVPASSNSITITNLVYGTQYKFEVVARITAGNRFITGPRAGPGTILLTAVPSNLAGCPTHAGLGSYIAITAVVTLIVAGIFYSSILLIVIIVRRSIKKDKRPSEIKMEACSAYGQVSEKESASHYESVKSQEAVYD